MRNPPHPGEVLREWLADISVTEAAKRLGSKVPGLFFLRCGSKAPGLSFAIAYPAPPFCAERSEVAESNDRMDPATSRRVTVA
jgi:hypothetical protein